MTSQEREAQEPHESVRAVPWVVAAVTVLVALFGAWTFVNEAQYAAGTGDRRTPEALMGPTVEASEDGGLDGQAIFTARCAACHQATGAGLPGVFPPLAGSEWVVGVPERPAAIVLYGLQGEIEVAGSPYSSVMPALGDQMSDEEVAAVLTYVRGAFGNNAEPVSPQVVTAVREAQGERGPVGGQAELTTLY